MSNFAQGFESARNGVQLVRAVNGLLQKNIAVDPDEILRKVLELRRPPGSTAESPRIDLREIGQIAQAFREAGTRLENMAYLEFARTLGQSLGILASTVSKSPIDVKTAELFRRFVGGIASESDQHIARGDTMGFRVESIGIEQKSGYQFLVIRGSKASQEGAEPQATEWNAALDTITSKEISGGLLLTTTFGGRLFLREPGLGYNVPRE